MNRATLMRLYWRLLWEEFETHVSEVEGDFQVVPEVISKLRIHVQHLLNIFSQNLMKVAVC